MSKDTKEFTEEVNIEDDTEEVNMEDDTTYRMLSEVFETTHEDETVQNIPDVLLEMNSSINTTVENTSKMMDKRLKNIDNSIKKLTGAIENIANLLDTAVRISRNNNNNQNQEDSESD